MFLFALRRCNVFKMELYLSELKKFALMDRLPQGGF